MRQCECNKKKISFKLPLLELAKKKNTVSNQLFQISGFDKKKKKFSFAHSHVQSFAHLAKWRKWNWIKVKIKIKINVMRFKMKRRTGIEIRIQKMNQHWILKLLLCHQNRYWKWKIEATTKPLQWTQSKCDAGKMNVNTHSTKILLQNTFDYFRWTISIIKWWHSMSNIHVLTCVKYIFSTNSYIFEKIFILSGVFFFLLSH